MDNQDYRQLSNKLLAALGRHADLVEEFDSACVDLLRQIAGIIGNFRTPDSHHIPNQPLFEVRSETVPDDALVVSISRKWKLKDNRLSQKEPLSKRVLTLQALGLAYYPGSGLLCGEVAVVLSDGDYARLLRQSEVSTLDVLVTLGMAAHTSHATLARIGDINRRLLDRLYLFADEPDRWCRARSDGTLARIDVEEYVFGLMDSVFNPEGKVELS